MTSKYTDDVRAQAVRLAGQGHSYAEIGRRLDVSSSTVARWARSEEPPTPETASRRKTAQAGGALRAKDARTKTSRSAQATGKRTGTKTGATSRRSTTTTPRSGGTGAAVTSANGKAPRRSKKNGVAAAAPAPRRRPRRTAAQRRKALEEMNPERMATALILCGVPLAQAAKKAGISQAQAERAYLAASRQTAESVKDTVGVPSLKHDRWITNGGGHSGSVTREHPSQRHALTNTGLALAR
jgi:transposase